MRPLGLDFLPQLHFKVVDYGPLEVVPFQIALLASGRWVEGVVGVTDLTDLTGGYARPPLVEARGEVARCVAAQERIVPRMPPRAAEKGFFVSQVTPAA